MGASHPKWYTEYSVTSWEQLLSLRHDNRELWSTFYYRGQGKAAWSLVPSLERVAIGRFQKSWADLNAVEEKILREFKRVAHLYIPDLPERQTQRVEDLSSGQRVYRSCDDEIEWIALMQHYGAPTRFLDWTYSLSIAIFFAMEKATPGDSCAVWGINHKWCWDRARQLLPKDVVTAIDSDSEQLKPPEVWNQILHSNVPAVASLNSFRLNERLSIQRGVFLAALDLSQSFVQNLRSMDSEDNLKKNIFKITIDVDDRLLMAALEDLHVDNINRRTLFPGLSGFCESIENLILVYGGESFALGGRTPKRRG